MATAQRPLAQLRLPGRSSVVALNWDDFRFLIALRSHTSLGAAARSLAIDPSTMSRRLSALEEALGAQLVERKPDGVRLNGAGQLACDAAEDFARRCEALVRTIGGADRLPEGTVRVSVSEGFSAVVYGGLLHLRETHPKITVELVVANQRVDLSRHEADIAVRLFRETNPDLLVRKVGELGWSLYASESYIARKGAPSIDDLGGHDVVAFSGDAAGSPGGRWLASRSDVSSASFRGSSTAAVVNAVKAGMGVSLLPCFLAAEVEGLRRLTPRVVAYSEAFLVIPPGHKETVRVRIVADALAAIFVTGRDRFTGGVLDDSSLPPMPPRPA